MSCEGAWEEFVEALNDWVRVDKALKDLELSFVSTPGQPGGPTVVSSEQLERAIRLMEEVSAAHERHRTALVAFIEAKSRHGD